MSTIPQVPDPQTMPLADLKTAAGIDAPATPPPAPVPAVVTPPVVPDAYTLAQDDNGVTITLAPEFGGEVFKGKDATEALTKLAKAKADANAYIKQLKAQPVQPTPPPTPTAPTETPEELATREWLLNETAKAHGMTKDQYLNFVNRAYKTVDQMSLQTSFADFSQACPDYSDTPENAQVLASYFPDGYQGVPSPQELKAAWAMARYEGKGKPAQSAQAQPAIPVPPPMPGVTASPTSSTQDPWAMDLNQLRAAAGLK